MPTTRLEVGIQQIVQGFIEWAGTDQRRDVLRDARQLGRRGRRVAEAVGESRGKLAAGRELAAVSPPPRAAIGPAGDREPIAREDHDAAIEQPAQDGVVVADLRPRAERREVGRHTWRRQLDQSLGWTVVAQLVSPRSRSVTPTGIAERTSARTDSAISD